MVQTGNKKLTFTNVPEGEYKLVFTLSDNYNAKASTTVKFKFIYPPPPPVVFVPVEVVEPDVLPEKP